MQRQDYRPQNMESDDDVRDYLISQRPKIKRGYVYVVETSADNSPVKIGVTLDPIGRRGNIQTANFHEVRLCHVVAADVSIEREIHWRLASECVRGEWFRGEQTAQMVRDFAAFARYQAQQLRDTGKVIYVPDMGAGERLHDSRFTPEFLAVRNKARAERDSLKDLQPSYAALASVDQCPPPNRYTDGGRGRKSLMQEMDEARVERRARS